MSNTTTSRGTNSTWRPRSLRAIAGLVIAASGILVASGAGAAGHATVMLNEASKGQVITVSPGTDLTVVLHSTYWSLGTMAHNNIVVQVGTSKTVGVLKGCVPGQGCGTVTAHFVARGAGKVRIGASRTSCGEALRCSPSQSHWTVLIRVR